MPVLEVQNLNIDYMTEQGQRPMIKDFSMNLGEGEVVALLGESGSGKSTCAKAMMGLLPESAKIKSGTIRFHKENPISLNKNSVNWPLIRGKKIGMIYQDAQLALNPVQTIREHFQETLFYHKIGTKEEIEKKSKTILSFLNLAEPEKILNAYPFELSGGMCQRVYIALVLCIRPEILIADEPTSALDLVSQKELLNILEQIRKQFNLSILLITHDIGVAYAISNRVIVLEQGKICEEGSTKEVLIHPKEKYTKELIDARILGKREDFKEMREEPLLQIHHIDKSFIQDNFKKQVLKKIDLDVYKGETVGILGISGCGKSTLAKCIVGLEKVDRGEIVFHGDEIGTCSAKRRRQICKEIQIVFQDARASLNPHRCALDLVQEPLKYLKIGTKQERKEKAVLYLKQVGICGNEQKRCPPKLSTGQCQRVAIARALIVEPKILLCDEAVSALDMILQKQILHLLQELQNIHGFCIIMISHDIRIMKNFCQKVVVMQEGEILECVKANEFGGKKHKKYTQTLIDSELFLE